MGLSSKIKDRKKAIPEVKKAEEKKPELVESEHDADFKKVIDESKARIGKDGLKDTKIKLGRGPGRPRKEANEELPKPGPTIETKSSVAPPPDISQFLVTPLIALSKIPASKTEIPELALTPDEALACAQSLNQVLLAFVPNVNEMDPKTASIVGAALVVGTIGFQKYAIYQEKRKDKSIQPPQEPEVQDKIREDQKSAPVDAQSYFGRPQMI